MPTLLKSIICLVLLSFIACQGESEDTQVQDDAQVVTAKAAKIYESLLEYARQVDQHLADGNPPQAELVAQDKLIPECQRLIALDPNYESSVAAALGHGYYLTKNYNEAATWLKKAVEVDPSNYRNYKELGLAYFNIGDIKNGQDNIAQAIGRFDDEDNRQEIVQAMFEIGNTSFDFGSEYVSGGEPTKGKDYQLYGLGILRLAYDLDGQDPTLLKQIIAFAKALEEEEVVKTYEALLKE